NWTITYNASSSVQLLVGILSPTNTTYTSFDMPLIFNVTLSQSGATVLYTLSGGVVNYTLTANASSTGYNATNTSISNGAYTFRVYANNSDGTRNDTASIIFSFRATNLTACGEINGAGYTYRLGQDILNAAGTCFNITSDHVILDGSGRIIDGDDTGSDYGIIAANRRNLTIRNINISDFASGIYLNRTHDSFIINATLNSNTEKGIRLDTSSNNSVLRGSVNASGQDALYIEGGISTGNNLTNVSIANTAANFNDFTTQTGYGLTSVDVNNTGIIDTYLARYNISSIGGLFFFISSGKAEIRFLRAINGSGANLSAEIILGNNTVFVNGSKSTLNKTANITFYGISTGFSNPQMLRDGTACSSPICNNLTSLNAGTVIFNVSSWSNYSIGEGQDIIAPVVTLNSLTGNLSVSQVTFNISTNESAGTALYSLHSGTINVSMQKNGNTNFNYTNTSIADGTYTVRFYVNDTSGNRNDSVSRVFTIDTTNPTVYLQAPVNDSTSGIATISFNATFIDGIGLANATFYLWNASALVNTTVGTLSSTSGSINLSVALPHQGRFFWNYRSSDTLSNYAFNNTNYTIVYSAPDTTAPAVYLQAPINGSTVEDGNVSFNATFTEGIRLANATFYLWNASALVNTTFRVLDGISNSTNISVALPHQGTFFWNYRVADNSSNYAFNHTNYTLIYSVTDAIVPLVTVNFPANTTYTNSSFPLIFNVSLNENGSRVWYTLDAWATNVSMSSTDNRNYNASNTSISDGSYVFRVFANDTSNNVNSSASVAFSVDRTLPLINVTAPTNISYSNATIQVNFSASDSNSINTRWFMNDTGNTTYTGVTSQQASEGSHIWRFYANDSNGNANSTSVTFSVDSVLPSVQFISPSEVNASNLSRSTILINVTASDSTLASIVIRLFNVSTLMNTTVSATSPNFINYTGLADGVYYFNATANDTQNNINVTETRTLKIDTVIPVISFISPHTLVNDTYVKTSAFTVNVSSVDANFANITLYLTNATSSYDVETFATANASKNYTGLADGVYYFNASSRDGASNTNSTNTRRVTVDTTIPLVSFISPHTPSNGSSLTSTSFAVNISVNETNLANITFYLSNSTTLLNTSHHISSILFINYTGLNATTYFVNASIVDLAGNINTTQVRTVIIQSTEVDTTAPVVTIILPVNVSYSNTSIGFNVSLNENGTLLYSLNGGITNVSMRGNEGNIFGTNFNHTNASISEGSYTFRIYANDTSGNRNETTQIAFSIDRTPPVITINFPANTTYTSLPITFNVSLNENGAVHYSLNGGITNVSMRASDGRNFNASNSSILNGAYSFIVYANDSAGNVNSSSVTFSLGVSEESTPASSAGGGGGGGGGSSSTLIVTPPKLKVIPEVLSVSSKTEETVSVSFTVFNTGNTRADVQLEDNLGETLHFADDRFTLEAGENRTIILLFAAYNLEPDVYTGKLIVRDQQGGELQVPVMYNVRSKSALFDVMLSIPLGHKRPMLGADLPFDVTLLNLGDLGKVDATLYYTIKNLENRTLLEFSETLAVETSISFSRTVRLPPEMLPGQHVIAVRVVYGEENVATASELFSAREPRTWIGYLLISALTLAILFIVLVLGYTLWKQHTGKTHPLLEQIPGLATH
ncbi:hypothetical protein HYZ97_03505, partial [Candidatus Pacearchaeota archaeon]|nr:hypothetical protein [Candidatus Pacearchaeota archaeon]